MSFTSPGRRNRAVSESRARSGPDGAYGIAELPCLAHSTKMLRLRADLEPSSSLFTQLHGTAAVHANQMVGFEQPQHVEELVYEGFPCFARAAEARQLPDPTKSSFAASGVQMTVASSAPTFPRDMTNQRRAFRLQCL